MTKPRNAQLEGYATHEVLKSQRTRLPFELPYGENGLIKEGTPVIKVGLRHDLEREVQVSDALLDLPRIANHYRGLVSTQDAPEYVIGVTQRVYAERLAQQYTLYHTPVDELALPRYMMTEAIVGHAQIYPLCLGSFVAVHMSIDNLLQL